MSRQLLCCFVRPGHTRLAAPHACPIHLGLLTPISSPLIHAPPAGRTPQTTTQWMQRAKAWCKAPTVSSAVSCTCATSPPSSPAAPLWQRLLLAWGAYQQRTHACAPAACLTPSQCPRRPSSCTLPFPLPPPPPSRPSRHNNSDLYASPDFLAAAYWQKASDNSWSSAQVEAVLGFTFAALVAGAAGIVYMKWNAKKETPPEASHVRSPLL